MFGPTIVTVAAEVNEEGQRQGLGEAAGDATYSAMRAARLQPYYYGSMVLLCREGIQP